MRVLRVGGVEEPFNLPWLLAFEEDAFASLGAEVTFSHHDGGTGELVSALEDRTIDLATVLTEGGVTAIGRGSGIRLHSAFTTSPLRWGIHVNGAADQEDISELKGKKFAISRFGSGSELMAYVLADEQGWKLKEKQFVTVGGIKGAVEALPKRKAHIFLWERFVTAPLVKKGIFKRIGELPTPWPAFYTAARPGLLDSDRQMIDEIVKIVLSYAARLQADPEATIDMIVDRYGMDRRSARSWLGGVGWPESVMVDDDVLASVIERMDELDRIETAIPVQALL